MEIQTGEDLITFFRACCKTWNKIYLQNSSVDEGYADQVLKHLARDGDSDNIEAYVEEYVKNHDNPAIVFADFVINLGSIRDTYTQIKAQKDSFNKLLNETKQRMKEYQKGDKT